LFFGFGDRLTADRAFCVLKELWFPAQPVLTTYHDGFAAGIAYVASSERLAAAYGAGGHRRPPATGTHGISALDRFQTGRALKPKRTVAGAFGAKATVPLDHLTAVDTRLFVSSHAVEYVIVLILFFLLQALCRIIHGFDDVRGKEQSLSFVPFCDPLSDDLISSVECIGEQNQKSIYFLRKNADKYILFISGFNTCLKGGRNELEWMEKQY